MHHTHDKFKANILENRSGALYITKEALASKPVFGEVQKQSDMTSGAIEEQTRLR